MPSVNGNGHLTGKSYWRSLDELADTSEFREFVHREFPAGATEMLNGSQRRHFLKIMGASMALAGLGLGGCRRWPDEKIMPFTQRPQGRAPGMPEHYATTMELGGVASGLLVTTFDGRPTKIEGNPEHPINRGATDVFTQASILDLYDPDRAQVPRLNDQAKTMAGRAAFESWATDHFAKASQVGGGQGVYVLSEASGSPSVRSMRTTLAQSLPNMTWLEYEPLANDNEVDGAMRAFGSAFRPQYNLADTQVILSLGSDFLGTHPNSVQLSRDFAAGRRKADERSAHGMSRLYVFESALSVTGAKADHRFAMSSQDMRQVAAHLGMRMRGQDIGAPELPAALQTGGHSPQEVLDAILEDLNRHRGSSLIIVGPNQPAEMHYLAHLLNDQLRNVGKTVSYSPVETSPKHVESIRTLARDIDSGKVQTLVTIGGNPAYNAPVDLNLSERIARVSTRIHLSDYYDETARCKSDKEESKKTVWHVNRAHYLESWGDGRAWDGTISITQPMIEPLFNGMSAIELLALMNGSVRSGYDIVQETFREVTGGGAFRQRWRAALHDGMIAGSAWPQERPRVNDSVADQQIRMLASMAGSGSKGYELAFLPDAKVLDGRFANNGWLQELPDPITKLTWDNALLVSPTDAEREGIATGDKVNLNVKGAGSLTIAVAVVPGQAQGTLGVALGYGRKEVSMRIAEGAGFATYSLRTSDAMWSATSVELSRLSGGDTYTLAMTQDHHAIKPNSTGGKSIQGRLDSLVREADYDYYRDHPTFAKHHDHGHRLSLWEEDETYQSSTGNESDYAWGMAIDLSACTGCNTCVIACQSENNIPIVGKSQVKMGREMHWIRVDRYFAFGKDTSDSKKYDPAHVESTAIMPMNCMHCENAPCEQVCPVAATVHDDEGLNVMVYNRCIGTRYCSNNCPYKVRRFNYFDFQTRNPKREDGVIVVDPEYYTRPQSDPNLLQRMQFNPEVTVRSRGVMEKCTYCVQRIINAKITAKNEWVKLSETEKERESRVAPIEDGSFTTACAQACPSGAIVFGDLNDKNSRVSKLHKHNRTYDLLGELNVKPRTKYLANLRNPNRKLLAHDEHSDAHSSAGSHS